MKRDEARIHQPCSADWNAMDGDDTRRFCGQCNKHVHNLSALTELQARSVVAGKDVCVRYQLNPATQSIRHRAPRRFLVRAVTAAGLTAGLALPAAAAISREPGEVGLLAQVWQTLTGFGTEAEPVEVVQGGLQLVEVEPEEGPVPVETIEADPEELEPWMGDVAEPIEVVELGEVEAPVP